MRQRECLRMSAGAAFVLILAVIEGRPRHLTLYCAALSSARALFGTHRHQLSVASSLTSCLPLLGLRSPQMAMAVLLGWVTTARFEKIIPNAEAVILGTASGGLLLVLDDLPHSNLPAALTSRAFLTAPTFIIIALALLCGSSKGSFRIEHTLGLGLSGMLILLGLHALGDFVRAIFPTVLKWLVIEHLPLVLYWLVIGVGGLWLGVKWIIIQPSNSNQAARVRYVLGRKYFHLLVALIAAPAILAPSALSFCALYASLLLYTLVEICRYWFGQMSGKADILLTYADQRDHQGLILTPGCLLLAAFGPILLEQSVCTHFDPFAASLGVIAACFADSGAAIWGSLDHHVLRRELAQEWKMAKEPKTTQGSLGFLWTFIVTASISAATLRVPASSVRVVSVVASALVSMLLEARSPFIDNVQLSLGAYAMYKLCQRVLM